MAHEDDVSGGAVTRMRGAMRTSLFRTSFFLLLRSSLNYGLGFVFWLVVAWQYPSDADLGIAAAILSVSLLLARIAALGLPIGVLRFLPADSDQNGLINGAFTLSALAGLVIAGVFLGGIAVWAPSLSSVLGQPVLVALLIVSVVFFAVDGVLDNAFVAARHADYGLVRTTIFYGLRLPLAALFVAGGVLGIVGAWTLSLVVSIVGAAALLPRFFPGYRPAPVLRSLRGRGIIGFSLWNYMTGIVAGASSALLPLLILNRLPGTAGAETSAYFYAAYAIATLLYAVPHSFSTSLLVEGSYTPTDMPQERRRTLRFSAPLLALGILGCIVLGPTVLGLFGPRYAAEGYGALVLLALASPIMLVTGIFSSDLQVAKRVKPIFTVTAISLGVTLAVAYLALPSWGIFGVAAGVAAGQATKLSLYVSLRQIRHRRPASRD